MEESTLVSTIDFFLESGSRYLQISGGEPTEHPLFFKFLPMILKKTHDKEVYLLSNGKFLHSKEKSKRIASLQKKYRFTIQITSIKNLYQDHEKTVNIYNKQLRLFKKKLIYLSDKILNIDNLGRAENKDFSYLGELYKRKFATCLNQFNVAKSSEVKELSHLFGIIENNTIFNRCKPVIDPSGRINPGEYNKCISPGNVKDISCDKYLNFLKNNEPCGSCGL